MYRHKPKGRPINPDTWLSGPDPYVHDQYYVFIQQRNQARFRKEGWDNFTFEQWKKLWDDSGKYNERGRNVEDYCMTRLDNAAPWTFENVIVIQRKEHFQKQQKINNDMRNQRSNKKNA